MFFVKFKQDGGAPVLNIPLCFIIKTEKRLVHLQFNDTFWVENNMEEYTHFTPGSK